jgi:adenylate cyclase
MTPASTTVEGSSLPKRPKIGLRAALIGLVAFVVAATALCIHLVWLYAARQNVGDVVGQLNRQIVGTVAREVRATLNDAWSVQMAVLSIFSQEAVEPTDEAKREFIFLALLRSHPTLSWIGIGFPGGGFFGALRAADDEIDMIEVKRDPGAMTGQQRVDIYTPQVGDAFFRGRAITPSDYLATNQPWYQRAVTENGPGWSTISHFPHRDEAAIVTSTPMIINQDFAGVLAVVVELDRLSKFLADLQVGKTGTVAILNRDDQVIAAAASAALKQQRRGVLPGLDLLARDHPMLAAAQEVLRSSEVDLRSLHETRQIRVTGPLNGKDYFVTFAPLNFSDCVVVTVIPSEDFLATVSRNAIILLVALTVLIVAVTALAGLLANRLLAVPLLRITDQLKAIEEFHLDRIGYFSSGLRELDDLSGVLQQMSKGLASFQKYMPTELVRTLVSQGIDPQPGGHHQFLTVMFTDIAGYTGLSEALGDEVVAVLAEYLERVSQAIAGHNGVIDKFIGDGVMAFWGAPIANLNHASQACAAALECQRLMAIYRSSAELCGGTQIRVRVGINTGRMLVGNIGSSSRLSYTVIGDPVNVASRLETLAKEYGVEIIVGDDTRAAAGDEIMVRLLDYESVYGRTKDLAIYELLGMAELPGVLPDWVKCYEAGLAAYRRQCWSEGIELFAAAANSRPGGDRPSEILRQRCLALRESPPSRSWTAVSVQRSKD